jgi:hypothetical protein
MRDMTSIKICDTSYPKQWFCNRKSHMHIKVSLLSEFKSHINLSPNENFSKLEWLMLFLIVSRSLRLGVLLNWETKTKRNETKRNTTKRNEKWRNETKRNEIWQNETKYVKQSIKDPKTINEGVKNQRNIEWLVRLFIDLHLDAFLLQNSKRSTKVMHQYSK